MEFVQLLVTGIGQGCLYGLVALGFVLIYKATEVINFAQGELLAFGAFFGVTYIVILGLPYWLGVLLTIISMAVLGYLLDMLVIRTIIGEPQISVVILTLSIGYVLRAVMGAIWGVDLLALTTPFSGQMVEIFRIPISTDYLFVIIVTPLLLLALFMFFKKSNLGIGMQASSQNQLAAYYMGIPVKRIFSLIWALSALVAGIAGIMMAPISLVNPELGFMAIKAYAAAIIGGLGSLPGALLGGLIIGTTEQMAGRYLPSGLQETTAFLIMFFVLFLRPQGLFSQIQQKKV